MSDHNHNASRVFLSFDFGMKHIGVAVGQALTRSATPLVTLAAHDGIPKWGEIETLIHTWHPLHLIVGIPLQMDDSEQLMTHCARRFANRLFERFHLPIHTVDERLSSWEAEQQLKARNTKFTKPSAKKHKKQTAEVNALAAAILLEQWMRDNII